MNKNYYIVVEGLEGAGKTTAIKMVAEALGELGITEINFIREPGGTPLAEKLRQLIKYSINEEKITNKAEILMLYAARIQLVENIIKPTLAKGRWVISDRHDLSSQAYQGGGRGLSRKLMKVLHDMILDGFKPHLTFYLDVEPAIGLQRVRARGELDRIEKESLEFFQRIRQCYLDLITEDQTIILIDANKSLEIVQKNIYHALSNWLKLQG